ncbi:MAG TPA: ANTAR domain-containing protein [Nordella sp.]|nr:ANTAR domain-containing protein [Nordella sp.]
MIQRPVQNFRGSTAILVMAEDRNHQMLRNILGRLGMVAQHFDPLGNAGNLTSLLAKADIVFVDTDMLDAQFVSVVANATLPVVAVIGIESPSRLQRAFDIEPSAVLMKPVRSNGVYTAVFFAFNEKQRRQQLHGKLTTLQERHGARRILVKAILHLMQSFGFNDEEAYRHLRKESMSQRIPVEELAAQILANKGKDKKTIA